MWLAENTGHENLPSVHHRTTLSGYIFATEARSDNWKILLKQQYLPHISLQYDGLCGPLAAEIGSLVWGTPANFYGLRVLALLLQWSSLNGSQPHFAPCLAISYACTLYIHFWRLLPSVVTVSKYFLSVGFGRFCRKNLGFRFGLGFHDKRICKLLHD